MMSTKKLFTKALVLLCLMLIFTASSFAQSPIVGKWKTKDDETGRIKSIVEITEKEGKYYGQVVELFRLPDEDPDPYCDKCEDDIKVRIKSGRTEQY